MSKIFFRHTLTKKLPLTFFTSLSLYIFTIWKCIAYIFFCRDGIYFDKILVSEYKLFIFFFMKTKYGSDSSTSLHRLLDMDLTTFYWSDCTKTGKGAIMYLCVRGIKFAFFYEFLVGFNAFLSPVNHYVHIT